MATTSIECPHCGVLNTVNWGDRTYPDDRACALCYIAKSTMPPELFRTWVKRIYPAKTGG